MVSRPWDDTGLKFNIMENARLTYLAYGEAAIVLDVSCSANVSERSQACDPSALSPFCLTDRLA